MAKHSSFSKSVGKPPLIELAASCRASGHVVAWLSSHVALRALLSFHVLSHSTLFLHIWSPVAWMAKRNETCSTKLDLAANTLPFSLPRSLAPARSRPPPRLGPNCTCNCCIDLWRQQLRAARMSWGVRTLSRGKREEWENISEYCSPPPCHVYKYSPVFRWRGKQLYEDCWLNLVLVI